MRASWRWWRTRVYKPRKLEVEESEVQMVEDRDGKAIETSGV